MLWAEIIKQLHFESHRSQTDVFGVTTTVAAYYFCSEINTIVNMK